MLDEVGLITRFEDTGDDALAANIRTQVVELNLLLREAKRRGITVSISAIRGMPVSYQVDSITAERKL